MSLKITPIKKAKYTLAIKGTSPYISHAWSEKALRMLRMTAAERRKLPKEKRDPEREGMDAAYYTEDGEFGIPAMSIKTSIITVAHKDFGLPRTAVMKAIFLADVPLNGILPLEAPHPEIREDIVRVGNNQTDLRYRPMFWPWRCEFTVELDEQVLNEKDLLTLVERAGFSAGIGEWRPERGGEFGRFEVDIATPMQRLASKEAA